MRECLCGASRHAEPGHSAGCPMAPRRYPAPLPAWETVPQDPALLRDAIADLQAARAHEERPSAGHFDQRCEALERELADLKARVAALEKERR